MFRNGDQSMGDTPNEQPSVAELMKSHDALQAQGIVLEVAHALCGISHTLESLQDSLGSTRDQIHEAVRGLLSLVESPPAAPTTPTAPDALLN